MLVCCPAKHVPAALERGEMVMSSTHHNPIDEKWDAFELDEDTAEPEPEPGDFWGELENDSEDNSR